MTSVMNMRAVETASFMSKGEKEQLAAQEAHYTEHAKANWENPGFHREMAKVITEALEWGFTNQNVFNSVVDTVQAEEGDVITVEEVRGMQVFATHRGGQVDQSTMTSEIFQLPRDEMAWHVSELEDDIRNNYGKFLSRLIPYAQQRETAEIHRRIANLVQAAVPQGSASYIDATSAGLTPEVLNAAITKVRDTPPPSSGPSIAAAGLTIIGRATAVDQILDFNGYAEAALEEIRKTGSIGTYRGANIQRLTNWTDEDSESYFPEDEIYLLSGNAGKFAFYGGARTKQWVEDKVDYVHARSRRTLGGMIYRPGAIRRIKVDI